MILDKSKLYVLAYNNAYGGFIEKIVKDGDDTIIILKSPNGGRLAALEKDIEEWDLDKTLKALRQMKT